MNTTVKIVVALVVVGAGVGAWFFLQGSDDSGPSINKVVTEKQGFTVSEDNAGFGSIKSIMGKGKDVECAIGLTDGSEEVEFESEGVVYIDGSNGQFRMNIDNPDGSKIGIISTVETLYQWFGAEGTKVSQAKAAEMAAFSASDPYMDDLDDDEMAEPYDEQLEYRYECKTWKVDDSLFVPPADVQFTDMDEMLDLIM